MFKKLVVDPKIKAKHIDLVETPIIVHVQKFDDEGVNSFRDQMEKAHNTGQPVIPILIDSYGGSVYGCLNMISFMKKATLPLHTIVAGKAMSAGAILFGMGQYRHMAEDATLMLHDASSWACGKTEEVKAGAKELERLNNIIFAQIAHNCGQEEDYFLKILHEKGHAEWYLNPKECKKHKLCTHIGVPEFKTEVVVKTTFDYKN